MIDGDYEAALDTAHRLARVWLDELPERRVGPATTADELHRLIDGPVPDGPTDPSAVLEELAAAVDPGLAATGSGRYYGFVNGGVLPAALGADWLVSTWDQNTPFAGPYPGAAVLEEIAGRWVRELLELPDQAAVGFTTGAQMANTTCLAAARHRVLAAHGHDVEQLGLVGAPPVRVVVGAERHSTIDRSLRLIGLGRASTTLVPADHEGRMIAGALAETLADSDGPTVVCAQAGNVNGGAFDPLADIVSVIEGRRGERARNDLWLHVDGAFGIWVRLSSSHRDLVRGVEGADSWATDAHKWLNTPYDCGLAIVADPDALRGSMALRADYLPSEAAVVGDPSDRSPESSRRARAMVVWAALRSLGRTGLAEVVDRCCARAAEFSEQLASVEGIEVFHQEINQVVVGFDDPTGGDRDGHTDRVLERVQRDGTCFMTGTRWHDRSAIRISVSNWRTDEADVRRSVDAIVTAHTAAG